LAINPKDVLALESKGLALDALRNYTGAILYYDKGLAIRPNDTYTLTSKGLALDSLGNHTGAIPYYNKALAINPKNVLALRIEGTDLNFMGNRTGAIQYYNKALAINPKDVLALEGAGLARDQLGNHTGAIQYYNKALAINPKDVDALIRKALALDSLGNRTGAIQYYNKALAINPKNVLALGGKGVTLDELGNHTGAIQKTRLGNFLGFENSTTAPPGYENSMSGISGPWTAYNNSTYGVKIEYPSSWERDNGYQEIKFLPPFVPGSFLRLEFTPNEDRLDKFVSNTIDRYKMNKISHYQGFKIVSFGKTSLKSNPAFKVVYTHTYNDQALNLNSSTEFESMQIFSVVGNTGYIITYESMLDNYPKYFQTAQRMIDSLEIHNENRIAPLVPGLSIGGNNLQGLAVDSKNNILYVVNRDLRSVSEIDSSTDRILANISVGRLPVAVTVNPNTKLLYVVDVSTGTVSVIDGSTNREVANIPTGNFPIAAAVNPLDIDNTVFVVNAGSGTVSAIDGTAVLANITVGKIPIGVAVNPFTNVAYVANQESNVSVIDYSFTPPNPFETRSVTNIPLGEYSLLSAIAINPNTNMVYVTTYNVGTYTVASQSTMYVINGSTNKVVSSVAVGPSPNYVAVNPNTNMIYVTNNDGTLSVINGSTNRLVSNLTIGLDPAAIAVNPNTNMVYITHSTGTIKQVNGTINKLVTGIWFSVIPSRSGTIQCGDRDISTINYIRYPVGEPIDCQATPNQAHGFVLTNIKFIDDSYHWLTGINFQFGNWSGYLASDDNLVAFIDSKYGKLTANFAEIQPRLTNDGLITLMVALLGLVSGTAAWIYRKSELSFSRSSGNLNRYTRKIERAYEISNQNREECLRLLDEIRNQILQQFIQGNVKKNHYNELVDKISRYKKGL
jgi:YVTN family beta-propeller protein